MRVQARLGLVVAALCGLAFAYSLSVATGDQRPFAFVWLLFGVVAALAALGVRRAAAAAETRSRGGRRAGVVAELLVILFGAWFWPLLLFAPLYVLFLLGGTQPQ